MPKGPEGDKRPADVIGNVLKASASRCSMKAMVGLIDAWAAEPARPAGYQKKDSL